MRTLIFLGALAVVGLVVTGAIKLQKNSQDTLSIQVDKNIVRQDGERLMEEGKELIQEASEYLHDASPDSKK